MFWENDDDREARPAAADETAALVRSDMVPCRGRGGEVYEAEAPYGSDAGDKTADGPVILRAECINPGAGPPDWTLPLVWCRPFIPFIYAVAATAAGPEGRLTCIVNELCAGESDVILGAPVAEKVRGGSSELSCWRVAYAERRAVGLVGRDGGAEGALEGGYAALDSVPGFGGGIPGKGTCIGGNICIFRDICCGKSDSES